MLSRPNGGQLPQLGDYSTEILDGRGCVLIWAAAHHLCVIPTSLAESRARGNMQLLRGQSKRIPSGESHLRPARNTRRSNVEYSRAMWWAGAVSVAGKNGLGLLTEGDGRWGRSVDPSRGSENAERHRRFSVTVSRPLGPLRRHRRQPMGSSTLPSCTFSSSSFPSSSSSSVLFSSSR